MNNDNDNDPKPFTVGERVRMRGQPWLEGTVWAIEPGLSGREETIVDWDDGEENAFISNPRRLERIVPRQSASRRAIKGTPAPGMR